MEEFQTRHFENGAKPIARGRYSTRLTDDWKTLDFSQIGDTGYIRVVRKIANLTEIQDLASFHEKESGACIVRGEFGQ